MITRVLEVKMSGDIWEIAAEWEDSLTVCLLYFTLSFC